MVLLINGKRQPLATTSLKEGAINSFGSNRSNLAGWITVQLIPSEPMAVSPIIDPVSARAGTLGDCWVNFTETAKMMLKSKTVSMIPLLKNSILLLPTRGA